MLVLRSIRPLSNMLLKYYTTHNSKPDFYNWRIQWSFTFQEMQMLKEQSFLTPLYSRSVMDAVLVGPLVVMYIYTGIKNTVVKNECLLEWLYRV